MRKAVGCRRAWPHLKDAFPWKNSTLKAPDTVRSDWSVESRSVQQLELNLSLRLPSELLLVGRARKKGLQLYTGSTLLDGSATGIGNFDCASQFGRSLHSPPYYSDNSVNRPGNAVLDVITSRRLCSGPLSSFFRHSSYARFGKRHGAPIWSTPHQERLQSRRNMSRHCNLSGDPTCIKQEENSPSSIGIDGDDRNESFFKVPVSRRDECGLEEGWSKVRIGTDRLLEHLAQKWKPELWIDLISVGTLNLRKPGDTERVVCSGEGIQQANKDELLHPTEVDRHAQTEKNGGLSKVAEEDKPRQKEHTLQWDTDRDAGWKVEGLRSIIAEPTLFSRQIGGFALCSRSYSSDAASSTPDVPLEPEARDHSGRAVVVALWCNFLVFALKVGAWLMTASHVMLAEAIHSLADVANQALLLYGLVSSRRAPDAIHPYGYSKERFVWSLISAVGIFCLGSGATIVHGMQNLWNAEQLENVAVAAAVLAGSFIMEGASLLVAYGAVKKGAQAEGMTLQEYLWRGHDPTAVAVLMEDGAAVTGLLVAGLALAAVEITGNPIWDPIGSIIVGNLLGVVAIFLIQRNRQALLGRAIDDHDMRRVMNMLMADPVVDAVYDCKSEVIGPGAYRFKAEIDFNGVVIVQNYLRRAGRNAWIKEFREAVNNPDGGLLLHVMANYGEEVVSALGFEVDRLEQEIRKIVPGIRHVDIEAHNPKGPAPREKFYLY